MSELGVRYKCFKCKTKFYDLAAPQPICPSCKENQNNDPSRYPSREKKKIQHLVSRDVDMMADESENLPDIGDTKVDDAYKQAADDMDGMKNENEEESDVPEE